MRADRHDVTFRISLFVAANLSLFCNSDYEMSPRQRIFLQLYGLVLQIEGPLCQSLPSTNHSRRTCF